MSKKFKIGEMVCPWLVKTYTTYDTRTNNWNKTEQRFMDCIMDRCPMYTTYGTPDKDGNYEFEECLRH
jgi:hypothetical protein